MYLKGIFLVALQILFVSSEKVCETDYSIYKIPGEVIITGIFAAHSGENCSYIDGNSLQTMSSVISAVNTLRRNEYLPGIQIGLSLYDSCSTVEMAQKSIVQSLVEAECSHSFVIGALMEKETALNMKNLTESIGLAVTAFHFNFHTLLANASATLLYMLRWTPIHYLVTSDKEFEDKFIQSATNLRVCIYHVLMIEEIRNIEQGGTIVVAANSSTLASISHKDWGDSKVFFVTTGGVFDNIPSLIAQRKLLLIPSQLEQPVLNNPFNINESVATETTVLEDPSVLIKAKHSLEQLQMANIVLQMVENLKLHLQSNCGEIKLCSNLPKLLNNATVPKLEDVVIMQNVLNILEIPPEELESYVLLEQSQQEMFKIGTIKMSEGLNWIVDLDVNNTEEALVCKTAPKNVSAGSDCSQCYNYRLLYNDYFIVQTEEVNYRSILVLREEAWVAALLSVSTVGALCCLAIFIFIIVRICKHDVLEGNPGFSFLMIFSVIVMYGSILPFAVNVTVDGERFAGTLCAVRVFGTSLSYSLVYSIMLARSLMLASCDDDGGFMSHINGYIQTILFLFITAVQVALILPFCVMNWIPLSKQQCLTVTEGPFFLYIMAYNLFLLFILICITPFIMKSKRNYNEGWYFSLSTFLCLTVCAGWCTGYVLIPSSSDIFICCGLIGTATSVLITVFIPRTYLMLTGIVKDHLVSSLPSLAHTTSTSVVDVNYRSTQALYDSVNHRGQWNPNYYTETPTEIVRPKLEDNDYDRYGPSPSPLPVTRF